LRRRETEIWGSIVRAAGATVSRQQLIRTLWPVSYEPNSTTIDVYVRRLRQKLGRYSFMLETRRGFGYRLASSCLAGKLQSDDRASAQP
jgi:DNA-binding response OmpR family regulator